MSSEELWLRAGKWKIWKYGLGIKTFSKPHQRKLQWETTRSRKGREEGEAFRPLQALQASSGSCNGFPASERSTGTPNTCIHLWIWVWISKAKLWDVDSEGEQITLCVPVAALRLLPLCGSETITLHQFRLWSCIKSSPLWTYLSGIIYDTGISHDHNTPSMLRLIVCYLWARPGSGGCSQWVMKPYETCTHKWLASLFKMCVFWGWWWLGVPHWPHADCPQVQVL